MGRVLSGPRPALPRPLDRLADWWAARPPRVRVAAGTALVLIAVAVMEARVQAVQRRWGGPPQTVLVAADDLGVGALPRELRRVRVPPALVPPGALGRADPDRPLAVALPAGAVLTSAHLDARGPGAGLADDLRAVPVPVEEGWGVEAGGWVDVWVLDEGGTASQVAASRPVLDVRGDLPATALVGLATDEVRRATRGLAQDRLLLTHAPAPTAATLQR